MNHFQDPYVWLYAATAVVIISLCGLFSVAIIPFMKKKFYQILLQFLVGLAVGSLSADAVLHLMPHALQGGNENYNHHDHKEDHTHHDHKEDHNHDPSTSLQSFETIIIMRCFTLLVGFYFFLNVEYLLRKLTAHRRQNKDGKKEENENKIKVNAKVVEQSKTMYDSITEKEEKETIQIETVPNRGDSAQQNHEVNFHGRTNFRLEPEMGTHSDSESCVVVFEHHGHSHCHGHEMPHSISSAALMVIMGDGLHNFCDGLAIGVAFSSSAADGISTALAVFCHELPHELGDFAMLLKTGMTVRQALFYNGVSSVLCLVGMVIGIFLGNVDSAINWIFAFTAGMFLYIAWVDMLPELTSENRSGASAIVIWALPAGGVFTGITIMLLIALYEHSFSAIMS